MRLLHRVKSNLKHVGYMSSIGIGYLRIQFRILVACITLLIVGGLSQSAHGQDSDSPSVPINSDRGWFYNGWSGPGVVLLKNGNVLRGDVVTQGNGLVVKLDNTGEISIASSDVVAVKSTVLELYEHQVAKTVRWGDGEHWYLAKWCLRNELVDQARHHYVQLKSRAGNHPSFKRMEAEIKASLLKDPVVKEALREQILKQASESVPSLGNDRLLTIGNAIEKPKPDVKMTVDTSHLAVDVYTREYFRQQIHPFMMLKCGQAGCHGGVGQTQFQITRSGVQRNRRTSDASLASAIRFLVEPSFDETLFMAKATTAHGTKTSAPLSIDNASDRELLDRLRFWHAALHRTSIRPSVPNQMAGLQNGPRIARTAASNGDRSTESSSASSTATSFAPTPSQNDRNGDQLDKILVEPNKMLPEEGTGLLALEREIAKLEAIEKSRKPKDSHDPAEFNQQYGQNP